MRTEFPAGRWPAWLLVAALAGCAAPPETGPGQTPPPQAPMRAMELPQPPQASASAPAPVPQAAAATPAPARGAADQVLAYADRIRGMPAAELAQEIQRLGETSYTPVRATQLALALGHSRQAVNVARAQSLLQRVLAQREGEAQSLHGLARLLADQFAEQRRADEQAERQARELRDAQRRLEQLNERLEAVRAIERSLPTPPRPRAPASRPQAH